MSQHTILTDAGSIGDTGLARIGRQYLLGDLDSGRWAFRYANQLRAELVRDRGGENALDATSRMLINDIAAISALIRDLESRLLRSKGGSVADLRALTDTRRHLLDGLERASPSSRAAPTGKPKHSVREAARAVLEIFEEASREAIEDGPPGDHSDRKAK